MAESDGEAKEGFRRKELDPFEATFEIGVLKFLEGRRGCDEDQVKEGT